MRRNVRLFMKLVVAWFRHEEPVVEVGSRQLPFIGSLADLRSFFPNSYYVGIDVDSGVGVDIVADAHHLPLRQGAVRTFIMAETIEHVGNFHDVVKEVGYCMDSHGGFILTSVYDFPIHSDPDYWRFTPQGFDFLLSSYPFRVIVYQGAEAEPHSIWAYASRSGPPKHVTSKFVESLKQELLTMENEAKSLRWRIAFRLINNRLLVGKVPWSIKRIFLRDEVNIRISGKVSS